MEETKNLIVRASIAIMIIFSSCSLYEKNEASGELENIAEQVLKKGQGIDIEVRPLDKLNGDKR
jgi:hypothetical protein